MNITARMQQILEILTSMDEPVSVNNLANMTGISKRTIQRELQGINNVLKPYELTFSSKTGRGIWLDGENSEKIRLAMDIKNEDTYDVYNLNDRRKRLTMEILKNKGLNKIFYYSSQFGVSDSTIGSDLKVIEQWLNQYGIEVIRKPGSGVEIRGKEKDYRRAIRVFLDENIDTRIIKEAYENDIYSVKNDIQRNEIVHILNDKILTRVILCLNKMKDNRMLNLTENSFVGLVIHIAIAVNRIIKEEFIDDNISEGQAGWSVDEDDKDYKLAVMIAQEIEKEFNISVPMMEISYICLHLKGAKHTEIDWKKQVKSDTGRSMTELVNRMIDAYDEEISFELKQDEEFIQGLLAHLQPTFVRLVNHMKISNPMLEDIKKQYGDIYQKCKVVGEQLADWIGETLPDEEVGFLAIHFGAAVVRLEGKKENLRQVKIGVVCASGIGISRLMMTRLENNFRDRAQFHTYGKNDITPFVISRNDFFVTSVAIDNPDVQVVSVNPLLADEDMENVAKQIYYYQRMPSKDKIQDEFSVELDQVNTMIVHIKEVIRSASLVMVDDDVKFDELVSMIADYITPYEERNKDIRDDIQKREAIGTQVFAELGFALLHAVTKGVMDPCISIWRPKGKVFTDTFFKGIPLVVVMLLPDDDDRAVNSEILGYISSSLIEDYDFLDQLTNGSNDQVKDAVNRILKRFFNSYIGR